MGKKEQEYYRQHVENFKKAHETYMTNHDYVEIKVRVTRERREKVKNHATSQNESTSAFINRAIDETIERDNKK